MFSVISAKIILLELAGGLASYTGKNLQHSLGVYSGGYDLKRWYPDLYWALHNYVGGYKDGGFENLFPYIPEKYINSGDIKSILVYMAENLDALDCITLQNTVEDIFYKGCCSVSRIRENKYYGTYAEFLSNFTWKNLSIVTRRTPEGFIVQIPLLDGTFKAVYIEIQEPFYMVDELAYDDLPSAKRVAFCSEAIRFINLHT